MSVYAIILRGGQGSRLGHVRKADLRLGGIKMLDRVTAQLRDHADILPELADLANTAGPLAGLASAVQHLAPTARAEDVLVSVAVDTPFLPADYVPRIVAALNEASASYAAWEDDFYPTNAAYRFGAIADLSQRVADIGSPRRLLESLGARTVRWTEPRNPFANLNTLADLIALTRRVE